jgi:LacI family repressor for deo operon, udp, cdd, tsx, nupC, and nupG
MNRRRANQAEQRSGDVRMKDLADYLGLSIATVSRAINHPDRVAEDKRRLIEDAIARLNYRPNLAARTLRRRESRTLLIIFPDLSPFFLDVFRGAEKAASELGYTAMMGHCNRKGERERMFLNQALSGRADGIVLVTSSNDAQLANMANLPPLVMMMEPGPGRSFPTVAIDHRAAAIEATRHLVALGHRRIAHICGAPSQMATDRADGFRAAIAEAGLDERHCYAVPGDFTIGGGEAAMERLLTRHPRPTAVFAANDEMAVGAMQAIKRAGLTVGADVSVVGFDDQRIATLYQPRLTTVHVPMAELGYRAVELLCKVIRQEDDCADITLETSLVVRGSTGAPAPELAAAPALARAGR